MMQIIYSTRFLILTVVISLAVAPVKTVAKVQKDAAQKSLDSKPGSTLSQKAPVAAAYLEYLRESLAALREQIPHISDVADSSAVRFIRSEALVRIRAQTNFASELGGRAAGLGITTPSGSSEADHPDAITLVAYAPNISNENRVGETANAKGYRILFAAPEQLAAVSRRSRRKFRANYFSAVIDNFTGSRPPFEFNGNQIASSSLMNIANGWIYTGEFTAALTRLGKMPVFYLSFAIDGRNDYERAGKYSRELSPGLPYGPMKAFHDDVIISDTLQAGTEMMVVPPLARGRLGGEYLDQLDEYLVDYLGGRSGHLEQILERATEIKKSGHEVFFTSIGHTFPAEIPRKQRSRGVMHVISQGWNKDDYKGQRPGSDDLMIVFGMPTYPAARSQFARENGVHLIMLSTEKPTDREPDEYDTDRFLWLETPWPLEDGAIEIPGYDIKVLPVTGFMNGALFWALALELYTRTNG